MEDPIRLLIVDDQPLLRTGFRMILESEDDIEVIGESNDGAQALDDVQSMRPDVVLMDIRMPRLDGVEATRGITGSDRDSAVKVLVLTTFDLDEYVISALQAGASGFVLKDLPPDDLVEAIRVVAAGNAVVAPRVTRRLLDQFAGHLMASTQPHQGTDARNELLSGLTERESQVFVQLGRGLSNGEIAAELYVSETTVKTHVGNVLTKLDLRDRVQAVVFAYETGVIRAGDSLPPQ